ncbi:MAG: glycosyltransferase family 39 protein [Cyanobacteria bacterium J06560_6]
MSDSFRSDASKPDPSKPDTIVSFPQKTEAVKTMPAFFDIFLFVALGLGVCLRLVWVGAREFWYDEVLSVLLSSGQTNDYRLPDNVPFSAGDFQGLLAFPPTQGISGAVEGVKSLIKGTLGDPHPPLFYLSEHGWMSLFGNGEGTLRSLVVLFSLAALVLAYALGRRVLGSRGGLIFAALLSLNPFFLAHSLNLRMYVGIVFWALASGLALMAVLPLPANFSPPGVSPSATENDPVWWKTWLIRGIVIVSITAGLLTQYLFAYWLFALAALALYLDRKHWFRNGLTLGVGVLLFMPWAAWGVRQQINNRGDVLNQISSVGGVGQSALAHGKDLAQTLANHLLLGHWTTGMAPLGELIKPTAVAVGCGVIGFVVMCVVTLYRRRQYKVLVVSAILGLVPLGVALAIDVVTGKYVLGFGWGRSTIVALPGCVLLIAAWLEFGVGRWRKVLTATILAVYLVVNIGDYGLRDRQIFHQVRAFIPATDSPTLVAMDSRAWGHVLRLVYYMDNPSVDILATNPEEFVAALENALTTKDYSTVVWLHADYPLWSAPETVEEAAALKEQTEQFLQSQLETISPAQTLTGTMHLDQFELQPYQKTT